ncbi:hypothetical protein AMS68_006496 [Peltaster fructicola]|uniref:Uncharacterized protein n=1 Tax=Peltaster fructicola TaxID=286661 RepID=A0A6H0Y287_9PEZI|nr:hypothetical protein AMS68_006496 [Peltaster fructicola]
MHQTWCTPSWANKQLKIQPHRHYRRSIAQLPSDSLSTSPRHRPIKLNAFTTPCEVGRLRRATSREAWGRKTTISV